MAILGATSFVPGGGDLALLREDLSNQAPRMITPDDAPFYKGLRKVKATALLHEFGVDTLVQPTGLITRTSVPVSSLAIGDEPTFSTSTTRARKTNRIQVFAATWKIDRITEILANVGGTAGIESEIRREIKKQLKQIAMAMEYVLLSKQAAVTDTGQTGPVAGKLAGFFDATLGATTNINLQGAVADITAVDESSLKTSLLAQYNTGGGMTLNAYMPGVVKKIWSETFTGRPNSRVTIMQGNKVIETAVSEYMSPVGPQTVKFIPDRNIPAVIAVVDMTQAACAEFEKITILEIDPNNQRNRAGWIECAMTLEIGAEAAHTGWSQTGLPTA
jgi:hypothetical protein